MQRSLHSVCSSWIKKTTDITTYGIAYVCMLAPRVCH